MRLRVCNAAKPPTPCPSSWALAMGVALALACTDKRPAEVVPTDAANATTDAAGRSDGMTVPRAADASAPDAPPPSTDAIRDAGVPPDAVDSPPPVDTAVLDSSPMSLDVRGMPGAFDPCPPAGTPCRIMPLGDSITHGIGSTSGAGYRVPLFQRALAANRSLTFVGSDQNGPATVDGVAFPPQHEGHRMFIIDTVGTRAGLTPLIAAALAAHQPHIITLMIGTNDTGSTAYASEAPRRMGELLDRIYAAAPAVLVVVAKIIPTTADDRNQTVARFNAALPAIVAARAASGKAILLVDMYQPFVGQTDYKTALMADNLHPNEAGFAKMADVWWSALQSHLRAP